MARDVCSSRAICKGASSPTAWMMLWELLQWPNVDLHNAKHRLNHHTQTHPLCAWQGVGQSTMGLVLDGLLVRDLQVAPRSSHSHFLQPLPVRCAKLTGYATKFRRRLLRLIEYTEAHRRQASAQPGSSAYV